MAEFMVDTLPCSDRPGSGLNLTALQTNFQNVSEKTCNITLRHSNQRSCRNVNTATLKYKVGGCVEIRKMENQIQYSLNKSIYSGRYHRRKIASPMSVARIIRSSTYVVFLLLDVIKGSSLNSVSHPVLPAVTPAFVTVLPPSEDVTSESAASRSVPSISNALARAFPPLNIYSTVRVSDDIISPFPDTFKFDDASSLSPGTSTVSLTSQVNGRKFEVLTTAKDPEDRSSQSQTPGTIPHIETTLANSHPGGRTTAEVSLSPESSTGHEYISPDLNISKQSSNMEPSSPTLRSRSEPEYNSTDPTAFDLTPNLVLTLASEYSTVGVDTSDRTPRSSPSPVMNWLWTLDLKGAILVYGLGVLCVLLLVSILVIVPSYFLMRSKANRLDMEARTNCLENLEKDFVVDMPSRSSLE